MGKYQYVCVFVYDMPEYVCICRDMHACVRDMRVVQVCMHIYG